MDAPRWAQNALEGHSREVTEVLKEIRDIVLQQGIEGWVGAHWDLKTGKH